MNSFYVQLEANLQAKLDQKSPGVGIWWNYTALGSHSSGGDVARLLLESNHTFAQVRNWCIPNLT